MSMPNPTVVAKETSAPAPRTGARFVAERLLRVHTVNPNAWLRELDADGRCRYIDAASVALAILEGDEHQAALYVAAQRLVDLREQSALQRRAVMQMAGEIVERYLEALAGRHPSTAAELAPLIAIDGAADALEGAL